MPDTRPGIQFNGDGICQACTNFEKEKVLIGSRDSRNLKSYVINTVGCMETGMIVL
jgi:hypothetical protein